MAAELKVSAKDRASIINDATEAVLKRLSQLLGAPAAEDEDDSDDSEVEEDDTPVKSKKSKKPDPDEDDDQEDSSEEDDNEDDDTSSDESDSEDSGTLVGILSEMKAIPDSTIKKAKKESAATPKKDKIAELRTYLKTRGATKAEIADAIDDLDDDELNGVYADYYARFLDTDGEVHAEDEPYAALRIVKGKEKVVRCCNGLPMEDGVCAVNPKIKDKKASKNKVEVEDESEEEEIEDDDSDQDEDETSDDENEDDDSSDDEESEDEDDEPAPKKRGRPAVKKKGKK